MTFRQFVNELWFQHQEEIEYFEHRLPNYSREDWFARVRWWLRKEYRNRLSN